MKKTVSLALLAVLVIALALGPLASPALAASQEVSAKTLNALGLFGGVGTNADGSVNFDLSGAANRQTAVTMLVRLLGKESAAQSGSFSTPFSDFDDWAAPYVGYAYKNGLVNGVSDTAFGGRDAITAQQYITLLLRALGYSDSDGDFDYAGACAFAHSIGLTDGSYTNSTASFLRGDIAVLSLSALKQTVKGASATLYTQSTGRSASEVTAAEKSAGGTDAAVSSAVSRSSDGKIQIDWGEAAGGVVKVSAEVSGSPKLCVIVTTPSGVQYKYFYTDSAGAWQSFVLSEGSGTYKAAVYRNTSGNSYVTLHSSSQSVKLSSDTAPFLRANLFVDYTSSTKCTAKAATLCRSCRTELEKVDAVYYFVVNNFAYDYDKAKTVQSGYRPDLDTVWTAKKGICFDYASTMAAMLRSQGVPAKLVVGYAGTVYHAWINVYTKETGWIEAVIYFDGKNWKLMDPTFASTGGSKVNDYITNSANYTAKYVY